MHTIREFIFLYHNPPLSTLFQAVEMSPKPKLLPTVTSLLTLQTFQVLLDVF